MRRRPTHGGYIPCKNFVMIGIAVLKLCLNLSFTLESLIHGPKMSVFDV